MTKDILKHSLGDLLFDMVNDKYAEYEFDYEKFVQYLFSIKKYLGNVDINQICEVYKFCMQGEFALCQSRKC